MLAELFVMVGVLGMGLIIFLSRVGEVREASKSEDLLRKLLAANGDMVFCFTECKSISSSARRHGKLGEGLQIGMVVIGSSSSSCFITFGVCLAAEDRGPSTVSLPEAVVGVGDINDGCC